jgi:hypothetical protein
LGHFYNLKQQPKENKRPKGQNSPNMHYLCICVAHLTHAEAIFAMVASSLRIANAVHFQLFSGRSKLRFCNIFAKRQKYIES